VSGAAGPSGPGDALHGVVRGLHHVAIVVYDIADARRTYEDAFGLVPKGDVEFVADQGVDVLVLYAGTQRIELVQPASPTSPVTRFLERRGPGLHHTAYRVDDVAAAIHTLTERGVQMIDDAPRPGSHGTTIAFVHPRSTGGVLVELVQDPEAH
jgi:methylmalonyl-CoA/ethylmalonyl-CoA epimerase